MLVASHECVQQIHWLGLRPRIWMRNRRACYHNALAYGTSNVNDAKLHCYAYGTIALLHAAKTIEASLHLPSLQMANTWPPSQQTTHTHFTYGTGSASRYTVPVALGSCTTKCACVYACVSSCLDVWGKVKVKVKGA